jgi:hypothetical protein
MSKYIQYKDTNYIILSDGRAARLLKPTKSKSAKQQYINFIINGKQERINVSTLKEMYEANAGEKQESQA